MFIRQLEYLAALDRERHFGRAAAACRVSQPALSSAIAGLETELGLPLVRRGRRFEGFTSEGERVLVWVHRALEDLTGLEQEVGRLRGGLEGTLRIGAVPTSLPVSTLVTSRFRERHPRMRIQVMSMNSGQVADGLMAGELDADATDNARMSDPALRLQVAIAQTSWRRWGRRPWDTGLLRAAVNQSHKAWGSWRERAR